MLKAIRKIHEEMYYGISTRIIEIFPEGIYCHYFGEVAGVMKKFYINLCKNFGNQKEIRFLVFSLKESLEKNIYSWQYINSFPESILSEISTIIPENSGRHIWNKC